MILVNKNLEETKSSIILIYKTNTITKIRKFAKYF